MVKVYNVIRNELKEFDAELLDKTEIILLTKSDILGADDSKAKAKEFMKKLKVKEDDIKVVSIYDYDNLKELKDWMVKAVREDNEVAE